MTAPGRHASSDGSFARSAGGAAARGGVLVAIAIALGLIILAVAYDGGSDNAVVPVDDSLADDTSPEADDTAPISDDDASPDDADDASADADDTTPAAATRPPGEVKVVVANGVGEPGLASTGQSLLTTAGYVANATNAVNRATTETAILYVEGYAAEAAAVALVLDAPAAVIDAAPADPAALVTSDSVGDFHIFVIQGQDRLAG